MECRRDVTGSADIVTVIRLLGPEWVGEGNKERADFVDKRAGKLNESSSELTESGCTTGKQSK